MTDIHIIELQEQQVAGVRLRVRMDEITTIFDTRFTEVLDALTAAGAQPAGAPYARYRGRPTDTVDVEVGFPVTAPFQGTGEVRGGTLPAVRAAEAVHPGSYDTLPETYAAVERWVAENDLQTLEESWEVYESGPESDPDPSTWRTRVVFPLTGPQVGA
ncbi:GyrI-like domain-containing protein [Georgenia subflava]|uniref:AraC family transcriptional regulator n=1 Tax=Georgenia subflava TaxID=1622177 RepID=A0A6N7EJ91_9MICO|nr:GyrI-like domain-containing protein [Georgenia subflava]MPV37123.1 AraC family transcriptional regulator [Georgenia subflava]